MGSFCTMIVILLTIGYAGFKFNIMLEMKDVNILLTLRESWYDDDYKFTFENGLNLAVAFSGYNTKTEWELDPSYGKIMFSAYSWGVEEDGTFFENR